jgi:branched-chain amino acid transport system permease protein
MLSFGQAGFFAAGAYIAGYVLKTTAPWGGAMPAALLAATAACLLLSLAVGAVCARLTGWVFAMVTLAFGQVIYTVIYKWRDVTGGDDGLYGIPVPRIALPGATIDLSAGSNHFYFVLIVVAACVFLLRAIVRSPFGNALRAIRDNPTRAHFIGLGVWQYKLGAFVVAGTVSGIAGALFSPYKGIASPDLANWAFSANPVIMSLVGGTGTFAGPLVGALVYRVLEHIIASFTGYWMLVFGLVLLACVIFFPRGVTPYLAGAARRLFATGKRSGP